MSLFDKMFKKGKFENAMDSAFEKIEENNPITRKTKSTIDKAAGDITRTLERELYGEIQDTPDVRPSVFDDDGALMDQWDSMIDQIAERELNRYKICPGCGESVSSELEICPRCGSPLPEHTAAVVICPFCGEKNKRLDLYCAKCGKELELTD